MKYIVTINEKNYEVEVEKGQATVVRTTDVVKQVTKHPEAAVTVQAPVNTKVQPIVAGEPLKAPMPGVILDIKVQKGTTVKNGEVLFILEAMKMENEITSPKDGIVAEIIVGKGASVATGDVLAVIE